MVEHIKAFLWGVHEFRSNVTRGYDDLNLMESYDLGRELAHKLTFRMFDDV